MSLPPSGKNVVKGSRPVTIPSSSNGMGRPRARSDHIYSKSEGHRGASFQWPHDQGDGPKRREEHGSLGGAAPFLFVDPSSLNSESSLNNPGQYRYWPSF